MLGFIIGLFCGFGIAAVIYVGSRYDDENK